MTHDFSLQFPYAYGEPEARARFRVEPEDFQVEELAGFTPTGRGEHSVLQVRKRNENTSWVAGQIARLAGVSNNDVGYCGRKDRRAVTSQWFSVYLPGQGTEPDWASLNSDTIAVLAVDRHNKKLRRGEHLANRFVIRLRDLQTGDRPALEQRLSRIVTEGVPNYFGEQRFGRGGGNLDRAQSLFVDQRPIRDRQQRGLILSAARSWLFNQVLSERVRRGDWQKTLAGDPVEAGSGPLWGRGRPLSVDATLALEEAALAPWSAWCAGLEHVGLQQERRALLLRPEQPDWRWLDGDLELDFTLPPGTFATAVLREIAQLMRDSCANEQVRDQ